MSLKKITTTLFSFHTDRCTQIQFLSKINIFPYSILFILFLSSETFCQQFNGKLGRIFDVSIKSEESYWNSNKVTLKGEVKVLQPVQDQIFFEWVIPNHVDIISGETKGAWPIPVDFRSTLLNATITFTGVKKISEPTIFTLQVYTMRGGSRWGSTAVYTSQPIPLKVITPPTNHAPEENQDKKTDQEQSITSKDKTFESKKPRRPRIHY